jgi:hypothetical protein
MCGALVVARGDKKKSKKDKDDNKSMTPSGAL